MAYMLLKESAMQFYKHHHPLSWMIMKNDCLDCYIMCQPCVTHGTGTLTHTQLWAAPKTIYHLIISATWHSRRGTSHRCGIEPENILLKIWHVQHVFIYCSIYKAVLVFQWNMPILFYSLELLILSLTRTITAVLPEIAICQIQCPKSGWKIL